MANGDPSAETDPPGSAGDTAEAVQAVLRAAIDVARQILDAIERSLEDPATAERIGQVVAGFTTVAEGLRHGFGPRPGARSPSSIQHIPIEHIPIEHIPVEQAEVS